ncbi:hypothetical protein CWI39_0057p0020 [Hamiltosporidium magnivora]|uniref:Uncharacterized protein n=1 Tax=Hamiltosporidium magnivora TaxID=148818 RepID=A0A4Q9LPX9_9MICR|nr:hypothetical protein CWI36_0099p0020 [Hamiltosporidium magnivora]TBU09601.1 hypothetical protein CWI39_0057p0020 [Hamiltosporidium magnivora]
MSVESDKLVEALRCLKLDLLDKKYKYEKILKSIYLLSNHKFKNKNTEEYSPKNLKSNEKFKFYREINGVLVSSDCDDIVSYCKNRIKEMDNELLKVDELGVSLQK